MYRNGVLSGVCLLCYGSATSALWKLSWDETASKQKEKSEQNDEPEQKAPVNDSEEAGGNKSHAGNGGQTTDSPKDNVSNPRPASVAYSPQNIVSVSYTHLDVYKRQIQH